MGHSTDKEEWMGHNTDKEEWMGPNSDKDQGRPMAPGRSPEYRLIG